jgi:uncharacterized membrane protein YbhN (UPF0104 family)
MSRVSVVRRLLPLVFGAALVAGTIAVVGAGPLVRGLAAVSPGAMLGAALLTAVATCAAAWRWRTVSSRLGLPLTWSAAIAAYYRSQFVNTVLPGGVLGDVHRAYDHGLHSGELPVAARAVATERLAGQLVQAAITVVVLAASAAGWLPPMTSRTVAWIVAGAGALLAGAAVVVLVVVRVSMRARRRIRRELSLLRTVVRSPRAVVSISAASLIVVAAHVGTFVVACLAVGIRASAAELVALALVALAAASLPINVGGWGPREAATAAAFGAIGWGAASGLTVSTAFGVLTVVAVLPGAVVLIAGLIAGPIGSRVRSLASAVVRLRSDAAPTAHPLPEERTA